MVEIELYARWADREIAARWHRGLTEPDVDGKAALAGLEEAHLRFDVERRRWRRQADDARLGHLRAIADICGRIEGEAVHRERDLRGGQAWAEPMGADTPRGLALTRGDLRGRVPGDHLTLCGPAQQKRESESVPERATGAAE